MGFGAYYLKVCCFCVGCERFSVLEPTISKCVVCCFCVGCERFTNGFWSLLSQSVLPLSGLRKVYEWVLEPTISKCCLCVGCERFTNGFWSLLSPSVLLLCGLRKVYEWVLEPIILKFLDALNLEQALTDLEITKRLNR